MPPETLFNPFPGLRPFEPDEDHLFFGREKEIDDLLRRLRSNRFLSVVGTSGSGKSSLVRSGLIPSLQSGFMVDAGSSWRVSILRPGEDPIGHLAEALDAPDVIGAPHAELASTNRVLLDATLRRGTRGLVDAVRLARIPRDDNVLIVVDQFEELFRFRRSRQIENSRDESVAFVKLLLEAASQNHVPLYVVLTMRSDFIGECMYYPGLPEAVNESQYLVPRMTRDELRSAITGPVAVAGGAMAPRLVLRLLNEVGDDPDQLPLLQHVLMRTWGHWIRHRQDGEPIDLANYEAVGTLKQALSLHAEEAFEETGSESRRRLTERIFKALTDTFSDPRGVRRPTSVADLAAICEAPESSVIEIVEIFRRPGRSFLMPPSTIALTPAAIVDLSHESLMRCWTRLIEWARDERASAALYVRLSREAGWFEEGAAGLWGDPELELGLRWKRENHPTAAWARRYDEAFDRAMQFLDRSEQERERLQAERRAHRRRALRLAWGTASVLLVAFVVAVWAAWFARRESGRASANLRLAKDAVDETLLVTSRDPARLGADVPQIEELRRELLGRAKRFYVEFIKQEPDNEEFLNEMAFAHFRLGHINRMLDEPVEAAREYQQAIAQFDNLAHSHPGKPEYRQALANSYNWLGETMRPLTERRVEAEKAYGSALRLQDQLAHTYPNVPAYQQELARTHYNRGILYGTIAGPADAAFNQADADFREAVRLLEPLARKPDDPQPSQELARAYNNLASLLSQDDTRLTDARPLYERAIRIHEALAAKDARNREYRLELAKFSNNLSDVLRQLREFAQALQNSTRALGLVDELARPAPSLGIEQADAHNVRARILQSRGSPEAVNEYRQAVTLFQALDASQDLMRRAEFHERFGDLLLNLASLCRERGSAAIDARRVLSDAVDFYVALGRRAVASGSRAQAQTVLENLSRLTSELPERDRDTFTKHYQDLQQTLRGGAADRK
jgi:tetratricopeptide (TPR) repeat protein